MPLALTAARVTLPLALTAARVTLPLALTAARVTIPLPRMPPPLPAQAMRAMRRTLLKNPVATSPTRVPCPSPNPSVTDGLIV